MELTYRERFKVHIQNSKDNLKILKGLYKEFKKFKSKYTKLLNRYNLMNKILKKRGIRIDIKSYEDLSDSEDSNNQEDSDNSDDSVEPNDYSSFNKFLECNDSDNETEEINKIELFNEYFNNHIYKEDECNINININKSINTNDLDKSEIFKYNSNIFYYNIVNKNVFNKDKIFIGYLLMTKDLFENNEIIIDEKPYIVVKTIQKPKCGDQYECIVSNKTFTIKN